MADDPDSRPEPAGGERPHPITFDLKAIALDIFAPIGVWSSSLWAHLPEEQAEEVKRRIDAVTAQILTPERLLGEAQQFFGEAYDALQSKLEPEVRAAILTAIGGGQVDAADFEPPSCEKRRHMVLTPAGWQPRRGGKPKGSKSRTDEEEAELRARVSAEVERRRTEARRAGRRLSKQKALLEMAETHEWPYSFSRLEKWARPN